jgi:hypothetical protein
MMVFITRRSTLKILEFTNASISLTNATTSFSLKIKPARTCFFSGKFILIQRTNNRIVHETQWSSDSDTLASVPFELPKGDKPFSVLVVGALFLPAPATDSKIGFSLSNGSKVVATFGGQKTALAADGISQTITLEISFV